MKQVFALLILLATATISNAQDTTFWEHAKHFKDGEKTIVERDWGREVVTYLGVIHWKSPSGKELKIRIVTAYQQITKANGFNDRSVIALVKGNHGLIKAYDLVSRQNLPIRIDDNKLIYKPSGEEISSALPTKFAERFCVDGLTCFSEINL